MFQIGERMSTLVCYLHSYSRESSTQHISHRCVLGRWYFIHRFCIEFMRLKKTSIVCKYNHISIHDKEREREREDKKKEEHERSLMMISMCAKERHATILILFNSFGFTSDNTSSWSNSKSTIERPRTIPMDNRVLLTRIWGAQPFHVLPSYIIISSPLFAFCAFRQRII